MVDRGDGEVAALVVDLVAAVAAVLDPAGVPGAGLGVDVVVRRVGGGLETDVVEDVELGLGGEEGGVADAGGAEVGHRLPGDVARVARVRLLRQRVVDEEVDVQRLRLAEGVDVGGGRVGEQRHVRLVDLLEARDRRAVEVEPLLEDLAAEGAGWDGEVLHHAGQVAEANIDRLNALLLDVGQEIIGACEHGVFPFIGQERGSNLSGGRCPTVASTFQRCYTFEGKTDRPRAETARGRWIVAWIRRLHP